MGKFVITAVFVTVSLLFGQVASLFQTSAATDMPRFEEKVNLALRRTGHHLLLIKGDSTSRIPAVQKINDQSFVLQLNQSFDYARLPEILQTSLHLHEIKANYDVAVLNCKTGELQLGYNFLDYNKTKTVPCTDRQQNAECYNVRVTFNLPQNPPLSDPLLWGAGISLAFFGIGYVLWRKRQSTTTTSEQSLSIPENDSLLYFGQSSLAVKNQQLYINHTPRPLTYREAKLLHLFVMHQNRVLERDFILQSVWEDEGITVGRSVDVFISRLRKLLQEDTSLKIAAVHGVGYRLEVKGPEEA